jgi:hypothetical protein
MEKVQKIDCSNTAPSSKTFREEVYKILKRKYGKILSEQGVHFSLRVLVFVFMSLRLLKGEKAMGTCMYIVSNKASALLYATKSLLYCTGSVKCVHFSYILFASDLYFQW